MKYTILSREDIQAVLNAFPHWKYIPKIPALQTEFKFDTFLEAIDFMYQSRVYIDELNHHPEWTNVYNTVKITLYTHDVKAVTTQDIQLLVYLTEIYLKV